jgi:hypothetical protein
MSTLEKPQKAKTRWGCLAAPIAFTLLFAVARIHDEWYERQPLSVHLRDVFKESGFEVPEYVSEGCVDFVFWREKILEVLQGGMAFASV